MIRINQLSLPVDHGKETLKKKAARILKVPETSIVRLHLVRRSIDARKKGQLLYSYIIDVELDSKKKEEQAVFKAKNPNVRMERTAHEAALHRTIAFRRLDRRHTVLYFVVV